MESQARRRKNFEAFVMTGDRMINLAKTPGNLDFQSKYYKPNSGAAAKSLGQRCLQPPLQSTRGI